MDLFKAIFASDDSDLSEAEDDKEKMQTNSTASFLLQPLREPLSHDKNWQDLSVVSSNVEQSKDVELLSLSVPSKHETTFDSNIITSNEKPLSTPALYGPSLPPGMSIMCVVYN